jgi:PAS domain S-box-containing protein
MDAAAALEILAGQAALAVERLVLSREVVRQRGEALFRTLVHDTSDVIIVLGDDRRIRFATPSAADFFGDATVAGKRLTDLVGPDGREDVDRVIDLMLTLSGGNGNGGGKRGRRAGRGTRGRNERRGTRGQPGRRRR